MRIEFTGRNIELTPALKTHVREKLRQAARVLSDVVGAKVVLAVEKHRHIAEIAVRRRRRDSLTGEAWSRDMYRSIQKAIERIEVQVQRKRERIISRKRRANPPKKDRASASLKETPQVPVSADSASVLQIVEEPIEQAKPMTAEEAALLCERSARPFVLFRSAATDRFALIYRRPDSRYGLMELD